MENNLKTLQRAPELKLQVESLWSPPAVIDNFLNPEEFTELRNRIDVYANRIKHEGKCGSELEFTFVGPQDLPGFFHDKISALLPLKFRIRSIFVFDSNTPFLLHTDAGLNPRALPYKNIVYCLEENIFEEKVVLYNAWCHFSVSVNDPERLVYSREVLENHNYLQVTPAEFLASENTRIRSISQETIGLEERKRLLRHIPAQQHEHFQISETIDLEKNRLVYFDSCQLHSGSANSKLVRRANLKRIVIFTEIHEGNRGN